MVGSCMLNLSEQETRAAQTHKEAVVSSSPDRVCILLFFIAIRIYLLSFVLLVTETSP